MAKVHYYIFGASVILLSACGPKTLHDRYLDGESYEIWYKPKVSLVQIVETKTNCQIEAAQRVPAHMVVSQSPSYVTPVQTYCNNIGGQVFCNSMGGDVIGGEISSRDVNVPLRLAAEQQCMRRSGHTSVRLPACPAGASAVAFGDTALPALTAKTCYGVTPDNRSLIIGAF